MTVRAAAKALGLRYKLVLQWARTGELPATDWDPRQSRRGRRVRLADIEELVRGQADHRVRPLRRNRVAGGAPRRIATTFLPAAGEVQGALLVAAAAAMTTPVKTMTPTRSRSCRWRRLTMARNGWDGAPKCAFPLCRRPVVPAIESQGVAHVWSRFCGRHGGGPRTIVVSHGDSPAAPRRRFPPLS